MSNPRPNFVDVGDFHAKFGLTSVTHEGPGPREITPELLEFRSKFMQEELDEFNEAAKTNDHAKMFDALLDLVYVAMGTAHMFGYPWQAGWDEVQRANISKERVTRAEDSTRGSTFDVIKPVGWTAPNIGLVLAENGFRALPFTLLEKFGPASPESLCAKSGCIAQRVEGEPFCAPHQMQFDSHK